MLTPTGCATMARYNRWMNGHLYDLCAPLADDLRKRDLGAPFRSIHGTLNHLLLADHLWMARFRGETFPITSLDQELFRDFEELRAARREMDDAITTWADTLTEARLAEPLAYTSVVDPRPRSVPLGFAVQHFFNHQTHHRGQLTALLEQVGCDVGVTDLIWLPGGPAERSE
jgi:uncharacterized damage-inducible protein DinB